MARTATAPSFKLPEPKLPKIDLETLFAVQNANLDTAQKAQGVLLDAFQAIVKTQHGYARELAADAEALLKAKTPAKPETLLAQAKAASEKAVAVTKQNVELGLAAQRQVAELVAKRAQANLESVKALAA